MRAWRPESALSSEGSPPGRTNSPLEREDNVPLPDTLGFPAPVAAACMLFILSLIASNVPPIAGVWDFRSPGPGNQSCFNSFLYVTTVPETQEIIREQMTTLVENATTE